MQTLKFDNLCQNFKQHEDLDNSEALMTATVDPSGAIKGVTLVTSGNAIAGTIPLTVPKGDATAVRAVTGNSASRQLWLMNAGSSHSRHSQLFWCCLVFCPQTRSEDNLGLTNTR